MTVKWAFAEAAIIARAREKDQEHIFTLESHLRPALQTLLGLPLFYRLLGGGNEGRMREFSILLYYILTTGGGTQTLGEEYCCIVPIDVRRGNFAPWWKRIILALWLGPIQGRLGRWKWMAAVGLPLHLAWFYWEGRYPDLGRRLLGMRYIYYPRRPPTPSQFTWIYGSLSALLASLALFQAYNLIRQKRTKDRQQSFLEGIFKFGGSGKVTGLSGVCPLCLELWKDVTVATCGHLFCWRCLYRWVSEHPECPICREACPPGCLYCLYQD